MQKQKYQVFQSHILPKLVKVSSKAHKRRESVYGRISELRKKYKKMMIFKQENTVEFDKDKFLDNLLDQI